MIPHLLSERADAAAARYERLTDAFQTIYSRALSSAQFGYAGHVDAVVQEAHEAATFFLDDEKDWIADEIYEIASEAQGRVRDKLRSVDAEELSALALEHLTLSQSYLTDELIAQLRRDIATLRRQLQHAILDVLMMTRTRSISDRDAVWAYRMSHGDLIEFEVRDRAARKSKSKTFVRALWRSCLLSVFNEVTAMTIADHGIERAAVVRLEDGVEKQLEVISLAGDQELRHYHDARADYFHPNANTYLDLELADV